MIDHPRRSRRSLTIVLVLFALLGAAGGAAAAPEGQMTWAVHGLRLIKNHAYSAPYEDLKLKGK